MTTLPDWEIIFYYRKIGRYALNALAACAEYRLEKSNLDSTLKFPKTIEQLQDCINHSKSPNIIVLWSFYSPDHLTVKQELESLINPANTKIIHIAGGVHASAEPVDTLLSGFDFAAVGEGESIIEDIITALINNYSLTEVQGLHYISNQTHIKNGRGKLIDLNNYPPCSTKYRRMGPMEITRGCVYACKFCQTPFFNKARFRHRSIDNIMYYAKKMHHAGFKDFRFITPTSLSYGSQDESVNIEAIETLLAALRALIKNNGRVFYGSFPSEIRPEHVTAKHLKILKKYVDNDNIIIGGQSGSQRILDACSRGHTVDSIERAVRIAIASGFKPNVDFLFGLPGETKTDIDKSLKFAQQLSDLGARIHTHSFMPLPGTPFYKHQPAKLHDAAKNSLMTLHASGKAYGQWQRQEKIAVELKKHILDKKNHNH